jgi:glycosyltransferase involved in cell wall biosynthesis
MARPLVALVIPTLNEEEAIGGVIAAVPRAVVDDIIVVDSGSTDRTAENARAAGARIVGLRERGYGRACRAGANAAQDYDIIAFLDGDGSDCPELIRHLVEPIADGRYDFVIGSRSRGERERGSMAAHQLLAGWLMGGAMRLLYGVHYTDMCPFRAIRRDALMRLPMREDTYGWNLEMQMRPGCASLKCRSRIAAALAGPRKSRATCAAQSWRAGASSQRSRASPPSGASVDPKP